LIPVSGNEYIKTAVYKGEKYEFLLADNQKILQILLDKQQLSDDSVLYILKKGHIHIAGRKQEEWEKHRLDLEILEKMDHFYASVDVAKLIKIAREDTDNAYDEIALNHYKSINNKEFLFVRNGFGIHPMFNTVYGNKNPWKIGGERGDLDELNFYNNLVKQIIK
jgi:hypothetical protein